ncbi:TPA: sensor histidine kinase [Clostridioides difficile]|nr:sensor histidine kinase [Clostridioides difficile]HEK9027401.1 sensor histidine kinase [Clostridioides difficile]
MRLREYIGDKVVFLGTNLIIFLIASGIMLYSKINVVLIFMLFCIWFLPLFTYMLIDYLQYKKYFNSIDNILDALDKKYLLPEVIDDVNFVTGEKINDILKVISRNMHENIKYYNDNQEEYKEYIETWVHEIKTPIASSKLIIENNSNEITKKIDTQLDKVENFVEQVLYYSKIDNVNKDYIIKKLNLEEIVNEVIKRNYRDFINKNIKLELGEINKTVYSDSKWVEFILNQIVVNSIKYIKSKDGLIKISAKRVENSIVLTIEDNGVGIVERDINKVFEKGFTGENGRVFGKSTGIGLYLCKKLCNKLGLGLILESKVNVGTVIKVSFPIDYNLF